MKKKLTLITLFLGILFANSQNKDQTFYRNLIDEKLQEIFKKNDFEKTSLNSKESILNIEIEMGPYFTEKETNQNTVNVLSGRNAKERILSLYKENILEIIKNNANYTQIKFNYKWLFENNLIIFSNYFVEVDTLLQINQTLNKSLYLIRQNN